MKVIIVGSGKIRNTEKLVSVCSDSDYIICADGGAVAVSEVNLVPDIIIGDLDSIEKDVLNKYKKLNIKFNKYPSKKDFTDMELCIDHALGIGAKDITIMGGTGSRLDHSLANIFLLYRFLKNNISGKIIDDNNEIFMINKNVEILKDDKDYVSIIPLSNIVYGITTDGFEYETNSINLNFGSAKGISNKLNKERGKIQIQDGLCLVIKSKD